MAASDYFSHLLNDIKRYIFGPTPQPQSTTVPEQPANPYVNNDGEANIPAVLEWYKKILADVSNGQNLDEHEYHLMENIKILDEKIYVAQSKGEAFNALEDLRNELYHLVYDIKEQQ
ncbi:hypothetical protein GCM10028805_54360 [Spirosoma harenae]